MHSLCDQHVAAAHRTAGPRACLLPACVIVQSIPIPDVLRDLLSPHTAEIRASLGLGATPRGWAPLSVDPASTALAAIELLGALALFFGAREQFSHGGVRRSARALAAIGFGVAVLAIAQALTAAHTVPADAAGPVPFGPFVRRDYFATWIIMAIPFCLGYAALRGSSHRKRLHKRRGRQTQGDSRGHWLGAAVVLMLLALLLSRSSSGAFGLATAAAGT